jgi:Putative beta-barrel porin-2, OmpL-like. bbp2
MAHPRGSSCFIGMVLLAGLASAQEPATPSVDQRIDALAGEVEALKLLVQQLRDQIAHPATASHGAEIPEPAVAAQAATPASPRTQPDVLRGFTVNALLDGYYEYNLNSPVGRANELRAYDVSSNSFSLNQADLMLESAPNVAAGKRYGVRLDFQFGQATSTLQGNPANEPRPDVYRNVYQAYGTYVFPVAAGLTVDFGKWGSSLGIEGNYTKDQLNYSRSFWFDYLPFYHMGLRSKLALTDQVAVNWWIANGANQTEDFNNYKDQLLGVVVTPIPTISWTFNYYYGHEHPDVVYAQGSFLTPIINAPNGRLEIFDSYISWQATAALSLALEGDYVQERLYSYSPASHVTGGALYAGYQLAPKIALALRGEYMADIGGLFSGATQYLKEETLSLDYRPEDGFLVRAEYRRDQSNQLYFLGHEPGRLEATQPTIGVGLVWWFGQKEGAW